MVSSRPVVILFSFFRFLLAGILLLAPFFIYSPAESSSLLIESVSRGWVVVISGSSFSKSATDFLLIRPQQKKAKQHREMLSGLKKGDRVVSSGGLHGVITGLTDDLVTMEIAPKIRVKVSRSSISGAIRKEVPQTSDK